MARYKPKTTPAKQLDTKTEVRKTADEKAWEIAWLANGTVLPALELTGPGPQHTRAVTEVTAWKLRREAAEARDELLTYVDRLAPDGLEHATLEHIVVAALEDWATHLLTPLPPGA